MCNRLENLFHCYGWRWRIHSNDVSNLFAQKIFFYHEALDANGAAFLSLHCLSYSLLVDALINLLSPLNWKLRKNSPLFAFRAI